MYYSKNDRTKTEQISNQRRDIVRDEEKIKLAGKIYDAAIAGDWRAAAWLLENCYKGEYGTEA